jgi:hypothetical protein
MNSAINSFLYVHRSTMCTVIILLWSRNVASDRVTCIYIYIRATPYNKFVSFNCQFVHFSRHTSHVSIRRACRAIPTGLTAAVTNRIQVLGPVRN